MFKIDKVSENVQIVALRNCINEIYKTLSFDPGSENYIFTDMLQ